MLLYVIIFYCDRYDHETDEDFAEMSSKEDEVIAKYKLIKFKSDEIWLNNSFLVCKVIKTV